MRRKSTPLRRAGDEQRRRADELLERPRRHLPGGDEKRRALVGRGAVGARRLARRVEGDVHRHAASSFGPVVGSVSVGGGGAPGEGEEHLVEGGPAQRDVLHRHLGIVERPDDDGQQPGAARRGEEHRRVAGSVAGSATPSEPSTSAARCMVATSTVCSSTMSAPTRDLSSSGVPCAMTRPPSMMTMEAARWSASSRYCVVNTMSVPPGSCRGWRPTPRCGCPGRGPSSARRATAAGAAHQARPEVEPPSHAPRIGPDLAVGRVHQIHLLEDPLGRGRRRLRGPGRTGGPPSPGSPGRSSSPRPRPTGRRGRSCGARPSGRATTSWPVDDERAAVGLQQRGHHADEGRLAGAVGAEDGHRLSGRQGEGQFGEGLDLPELLR